MGSKSSRLPWFMVGLTASSLGMWMVRFGQSMVALEVDGGGATAVGITVMLQFVPAVVLGLAIGTLADRIGPLRLLYAGQVLMVATVAVEAGLIATGMLNLWWAYALATLFGVGSAVDHPLRLTALPTIVEIDRVQRAVSMSMFVNQLMRMGGPALAAVVATAAGYSGVFVLCAASLAVFVPILARLNRTTGAPQPASAVDHGIRPGLAYLRTRTDLVTTFMAIAVGGLVGGSLPTIAVLMGADEMGLSTLQVGIANAAVAMGTVAGVLVASRLPARSVPVIVASVALLGASSAAVAFARSAVPLFVTLAAAGVFALVMVTLGSSFVQITVAPQFRSRVTSVFSIALIIGTPIAAPPLGVLTDGVGARPAVAILGATVAAVAVAVAASATYRARRSPRSLGDPAGRAPASSPAGSPPFARDAED